MIGFSIRYITQPFPMDNCDTLLCVKTKRKKLKHTRIQSTCPFSMVRKNPCFKNEIEIKFLS